MKKNLGLADRIIRLVIAAVLAILYFTGTVSGGWSIVLLVVAVIVLMTSILSFCPIYWSLKLSSITKKK